MKSTTILAIAAICFFVIGCKFKTAKDYNDWIVKKQTGLVETINQEEPKLRAYFASFEYDSIASVSTQMETRIEGIIGEIRKKPAPDATQGGNFKKAALRYFDYMKSIYTSYKNYGLQSTPEGRQMHLQIMAGVTAQENKMIDEMQQAQRIFAKDNGFKIRSTKKNGSMTASPPSQ